MPHVRTNEWRTRECGCRLQKSLWTSPTSNRTREVWVFREYCAPHQAEQDEILRMLSEGGCCCGPEWNCDEGSDDDA